MLNSTRCSCSSPPLSPGRVTLSLHCSIWPPPPPPPPPPLPFPWMRMFCVSVSCHVNHRCLSPPPCSSRCHGSPGTRAACKQSSLQLRVMYCKQNVSRPVGPGNGDGPFILSGVHGYHRRNSLTTGDVVECVECVCVCPSM